MYVSHVSGRNLKEGLSVFCTVLQLFQIKKKKSILLRLLLCILIIRILKWYIIYHTRT